MLQKTCQSLRAPAFPAKPSHGPCPSHAATSLYHRSSHSGRPYGSLAMQSSVQTVNIENAIQNEVHLTGKVVEDMKGSSVLLQVGPADWYLVELSGDDAERREAARLLKADTEIHVKGQFRLDSTDSTKPPRPAVEAREIFLRSNSSAPYAPTSPPASSSRMTSSFSAPARAPAAPAFAPAASASQAPGAPRSQPTFGEVSEWWEDVLSNPNNWWDNRSKKSNPRAPDFKHKSQDKALWVDSRSTPPHVVDRLPPRP